MKNPTEMSEIIIYALAPKYHGGRLLIETIPVVKFYVEVDLPYALFGKVCRWMRRYLNRD